MSDVMKWYAGLVGDDSVNAAAERAGIVQSTLNRQVSRGALSPESVVALARAYDVDVLDSLVACGLIVAADIERHGIKAMLASVSDADLGEEIRARLTRSSQGPLAEPLTD